MPFTQLNLKTALIGTTTISLLAIATPAIAVTLRANIQLADINPSNFQAQFELNPVAPANSNANPVSFRRAVSKLNLLIGSTPVYSSSQLLPLRGIRFVNDSSQLEDSIAGKFGMLGFTLLSGPVYQYTFAPPFSLPGRDNVINFYVPSNFIYNNLFSVPLSSNADQNFLRTDLSNGLGKILEIAKRPPSSLNIVVFPAFIGFPPPAAVPEPNSSPSLIVFGLGLGLIALKKNHSQKH